MEDKNIDTFVGNFFSILWFFIVKKLILYLPSIYTAKEV